MVSVSDLSSFINTSSIRIYDVAHPGGLGMDNFEFDVATVVPEPGMFSYCFTIRFSAMRD
jgi:hypothetical protein